MFDIVRVRDDGPRWHPMLLARENPPTHWDFLDAVHKVAGTIDLRRTQDGPRTASSAAGNSSAGPHPYGSQRSDFTGL